MKVKNNEISKEVELLYKKLYKKNFKFDCCRWYGCSDAELHEKRLLQWAYDKGLIKSKEKTK